MRFLIWFILTMSAVNLSGQSTMLPSETGLLLSWFSDGGIHPGGRIGLDHALYVRENRKEVPNNRGGFNRTLSSQFIIQPSAGYYQNTNNHNGLFVNLEVGYRNIYHRSTFGKLAFRTDFTVGVTNTIYSNSGDVSQEGPRAAWAGTLKSRPIAGFTLAQDYWVSHYTLPLSVFVKGSAVYGLGQFFPALEVGVLFRGFAFPPLPQKRKFSRN